MDSSPTTPLRPDVNTSRLLRLLRPYTSHLAKLEQSLRADPDYSTYPVIPQGIALTADRPKPNAKRTYGKSLRPSHSTRGYCGPSVPLEDVFLDNAAACKSIDDVYNAQMIKSHLGLARYASVKNESTRKVYQQATSVVSAFRRLCEVAKPPPITLKGKTLLLPGTQKQRSVPKLSTICANIIGRNLEGYVKAEWISREREKAGLQSDDSGLQVDYEEEEDTQQEYQDQSWRIERLQEWYDALPGHVVGTVLVEQAISLALSLPYHPIRADVLWTLFETVCEQEAVSDFRPILRFLVQDIIVSDYRKIPLVLTGVAGIIFPRKIPMDIQTIVISHMSNRKKYLAMCLDPASLPLHCEVGASMVAHGLDFTYNTADQRQIDEFGDHTARWVTLWTKSTCSATAEEKTHAWATLNRCLVDIGFLSDPLPVDNSPNVYLVAFAICLLDTTHSMRDENASLRKALRCLRSNPGIDFNILHPEAVTEFAIKLLKEPQWKTDCPHLTRWFLSHALRCGAVDLHQNTIAEWIEDLESIMPEVEELDVDTKNAYAKLGYVWDTTFDSWIKQTPTVKFGRSLGRPARCPSQSDLSSSPVPQVNSEDSGFYSEDRSSPSAYRSSSPPTPVIQHRSSVSSNPAVKVHAFSSPFMNSPIVKSSLTPKNILKNRHANLKQPVQAATLITPLHPTKKIQPSTGESIDPLDDIEELDKTTPVLPKRVVAHIEAIMSDDDTSEQDENDPLADNFSESTLGSPWHANDPTPKANRADKRKVTVVSSPLRSDWSKKRHLR